MTNYYDSFLKECALQKSILLGDFCDGKYVISREIIDELIKIDKQILTYKLDYVECSSSINNHKLNFIIKFYVNDIESRKFSSLYLQEEYNLLGKKEKLETFLVNFNDYDDPDYFDKLKKVFNLYTKDESEGKEIKYKSEILEKLIKNKNIFSKSITNVIGIENRNYVLDVLKILQKSGDVGREIQIFLKQQMKNIKIDKNSVLYWEKLKGILDELILSKYDKFSDETKKWLELVNQNYILMYNKKQKDLKLSNEVAKKSSKKPIIKNEEKKAKKQSAKKSASKKVVKVKKAKKEKSNSSSSLSKGLEKYKSSIDEHKELDINVYDKEIKKIYSVKTKLGPNFLFDMNKNYLSSLDENFNESSRKPSLMPNFNNSNNSQMSDNHDNQPSFTL